MNICQGKVEKLTNSLISRPNGSESKWLALLLQENKMYLDRTQSISPCQLEPGLLWCLISSSANPFLNRWIPAGSMGVVVFTDLSSSVLGDYRIAAPMQSKTIKRCAWLNWLTQHSHQLGSDIPACFVVFFPLRIASEHELTPSSLLSSHLDRPDISDYFECHLNGRANHTLQVCLHPGASCLSLITVSKEMMCLAIGSIIATSAHHLSWGGFIRVGCCGPDTISTTELIFEPTPQVRLCSLLLAFCSQTN